MKDKLLNIPTIQRNTSSMLYNSRLKELQDYINKAVVALSYGMMNQDINMGLYDILSVTGLQGEKINIEDTPLVGVINEIWAKILTIRENLLEIQKEYARAYEAFQQWGGRWLGASSSDPQEGPYGEPIVDGALYVNTNERRIRTYSQGWTDAWVLPKNGDLPDFEGLWALIQEVESYDKMFILPASWDYNQIVLPDAYEVYNDYCASIEAVEQQKAIMQGAIDSAKVSRYIGVNNPDPDYWPHRDLPKYGISSELGTIDVNIRDVLITEGFSDITGRTITSSIGDIVVDIQDIVNEQYFEDITGRTISSSIDDIYVDIQEVAVKTAFEDITKYGISSQITDITVSIV